MRSVYAGGIAVLLALTAALGACSASAGPESAPEAAKAKPTPTVEAIGHREPPEFDFEMMIDDPDEESLVFSLQGWDSDGLDYETVPDLFEVRLNLYYACPPEISIEVFYRTGADEVPVDWGIVCDGNMKGQAIDAPHDAAAIEAIVVRGAGTGAWGIMVTELLDEDEAA